MKIGASSSVSNTGFSVCMAAYYVKNARIWDVFLTTTRNQNHGLTEILLPANLGFSSRMLDEIAVW